MEAHIEQSKRDSRRNLRDSFEETCDYESLPPEETIRIKPNEEGKIESSNSTLEISCGACAVEPCRCSMHHIVTRIRPGAGNNNEVF